jgi:predicted TPR repeat methyltransferase
MLHNRRKIVAKENFFDIAYTLKSSEETKAMYDRWSQVYDQDLTTGNYQQPARCAQALSELCTDKSINILDIGCGTGLSGLALKEQGYMAIDGCDLSQGMLDKAGELEIYRRLFSCNLNEPPIDAKDADYDAVTAVGVFSFGHIMPDAVDEMLRVLKPAGTMIIGLNDHYYDEGSLTRKLELLENQETIEIVKKEHGEHIPENDLKGWVITLRKR